MSNTSAPLKLGENKKLHGLDHLRAIAITSVCLFHYGLLPNHPSWFSRISSFGWTGVDLFFVLSGYLIASQLFAKIAAGKKISLKNFVIKRFFRIIPAYLVVVAIYFCIPWAREWESLAPLWKYLTFTYNIAPDLNTETTFVHSWSLCLEEQFYIILPVILGLLIYYKAIKKAYWLLIGFFVLGFVARFLSYQYLVTAYSGHENMINWYKWVYFPSYCRLDGLLVGVSIAALFEFRPLWRDRICKYGNLFIMAGLFILLGAFFLSRPFETLGFSLFGFPLISIGYGAIVIGAISPVTFLYKYSSKITAIVATLSYALYLIHKIMMHITLKLFSDSVIGRSDMLMLLASVTICFTGAFILNRLVEKPFLRLRNKILTRG